MRKAPYLGASKRAGSPRSPIDSAISGSALLTQLAASRTPFASRCGATLPPSIAVLPLSRHRRPRGMSPVAEFYLESDRPDPLM